MIISVHEHIVAPPELYSYQANLLNGRGFHGKGSPNISEERNAQFGQNHVKMLKEVGTDIALISPRPFTMMNSQKPEKIVHWFTEWTNDLIAQQVKLFPDTFRGVAGLPQCAGVSPENSLEELERCVKELGFVGCLINPDPGEGDGLTPPLGDEHWYPLYEKLVEMDVPALLHPASCLNPRESFHNHFITEASIAILSLASSRVFQDFPNLKIIVNHGGGSIPYQVGRWRALSRFGATETFDDRLRKLHFDTVLYNQESMELLFKIVGTDRCMFGAERPGAGSAINPKTGKSMDDLRPLIEAIPWLSEQDRRMIFEENARRVYTRLNVEVAQPAVVQGRPGRAAPQR